MYRWNPEKGYYIDSTEGVSEQIVELEERVHAMLYTPEREAKPKTGVVIMHSDQNYMYLPMGPAFARRGFAVIAAEASDGGEIDRKIETLGKAVTFLKEVIGVKYTVLMGHSGGATLISACQAIAENGPGVFQNKGMIWECTVRDTPPAADGVMLIDANYGNAPMMILSLDPGVKDDETALGSAPAFDIFSPESGYAPDGAHYSETFIRTYQKAQARRNKRLIDAALKRFSLIKAGQGRYEDDEPFIVAGANQMKPNNKMLPEDTSFFTHTKEEQDLLHADGTVTRGIVHGVRRPEFGPFLKGLVNKYSFSADRTTVKGFLSAQAIRTTEEFGAYEDGLRGVDYDSSYASPVGNVQYIHAPLLLMGLTGSYEYIASEQIHAHAASADKTLLFVHGASHMFFPCREAEKYPGEFGDTENAIYDAAAAWIRERF